MYGTFANLCANWSCTPALRLQASEGSAQVQLKGSGKKDSLPEFMNFKLFGKTIFVVNINIMFFWGHPLSK